MTTSTRISGIAPYSPDLVWFSGNDAERFLNDLISQEIGDMNVGESRRSFLLHPQGKLDHVLWVYKEDDRFALLTDTGRGEELAGSLGRYRIRVDVTIEVETEPVWLVVGDWMGIDVSWDGVARHVVVGAKPDLETVSEDDYARLRIEAREPLWGVDVDDTTIPHESGLVESSVDFDKGCFLGQELVARIDSRGGSAPRRLALLDVEGDVSVGEELMMAEDPVGVITSVAGDIAMASVKRSVESGDSVLLGDRAAVVRGP